MIQHFLLSARYRDFSWQEIYSLTEEQAYEKFCEIRFEENDGHPFCPHCGNCDAYALKTRRVFKCGLCKKQFSATSGTLFADRKLSFKQLIIAIALFAMPSCGRNTIELSADLNVQYKTAYVLAGKLREFMRIENEALELQGAVEVDGSQWGGYIRPKNVRKEPTDHYRYPYKDSRREKHAVAIREKRQYGKVKVFIGDEQYIGQKVVYKNIVIGTQVHTDMAGHWHDFEEEYDWKPVNHSTQFSSPEACTNKVESFFSHMQKLQDEYGSIAKRQFDEFVFEGAWRLNHMRASRSERVYSLAAAVRHIGVSKKRGYWGRYSKRQSAPRVS